MGLREEIIALEKASKKEILKIMTITKLTKVEYIYSTLLNCMFRYDKIRIFIIGLKQKGEKEK